MHIGTHTGLAIQVSALATGPIDVAHRVIQAFNQLKLSLLPRCRRRFCCDTSVFKRCHRRNVLGNCAGDYFMVLVVILFLGSFSEASVVVVTIPISLMGVFFLIKLMGFR